MLALLAGCGDKATSGSASGAVSGAGGSAAPEKKKDKTTCADWGGTGSLTFQDPCKLKPPSPVKAKWTGKYVKGSSGEVPEVEVENGFDLELSWGFVNVFYYDKDGKQLEITYESGTKTKRHYENGSGILKNIKPGEKKMLALGPPKSATPEGTETIEVEITGFALEHAENAKKKDDKHFRVDVGVPSFDERPKGGWK